MENDKQSLIDNLLARTLRLTDVNLTLYEQNALLDAKIKELLQQIQAEKVRPFAPGSIVEVPSPEGFK